ncbi:unnamed protein product [Clonostachys rosea]|uniref:Mitochondrial import inner membrane translocase subunit Tim21 n=1 Tax=Bionectria ochroleuca TaxID=29856 RepID=A0ABY6U1G2_BIOOC|nr:unnamed protein product [Clonostachys rosea]
MNPTKPLAVLRPVSRLTSIRPLLSARPYATQGSTNSNPKATSRRRSVTPFNDTGFVPWSELSVSEKAARATQQSFNFGMVIVGVVLTGGVGYFLWHDVFSPDSKTAQFNRALEKVKDDHRCIELLGNPRKISAHGDETLNSWRRARPVTSTERTDPDGTQHLIMHFYVRSKTHSTPEAQLLISPQVNGPLNNGVVRLHTVKYRNSDDFHYKYLFLDVKEHERVYLEKEDPNGPGGHRKQLSFFGVKWG